MDGEIDSPLPKRAVMIMKYFSGFRALVEGRLLPSGSRSQMLSDISEGTERKCVLVLFGADLGRCHGRNWT